MRPGRPISFSWHAARELRKAGWTYVQIGDALGVSHHAVMYACDPYYRNRKRRLNNARNAAKRQRAAMVVGRGRGL